MSIKTDEPIYTKVGRRYKEVGSDLLDRGYECHTEGLKQIHRKGNDFYWSEKRQASNNLEELK